VADYGRSLVGERVYKGVSGKMGKRVNVIGAWSKKLGLMAEELLENVTVNRERFVGWISDKLLPLLNERSVVVMDNASWHKGGRVKELIEGAQAKLLYLPPYSPDLNPIEQIWGVLKNKIRHCADVTTELSQKIKKIAKSLQKHSITD
jgi:transposase